MRVLMLAPSMHPREGGPPRVVVGQALALRRAGIEVEIATIGLPDEEADTRAAWPDLTPAGVSMHIFPRGFPQVIGRSGALTRWLKANGDRYDLLHVHCIWETGLAQGSAVFRAKGKPTLITCHGMLDRWQLRRSAWKKALAQRLLGTGAMLRGADALLYGSVEEAEEATPLALPARSLVVPNGINPHESDTSADAAERLLARLPAVRGWKRTVLYFSRMHPKKGIDMLVEAFGRLHGDFPDTGLLIAAIQQDQAYGEAVAKAVAELQPAKIALACEPKGLKAQEAFSVADIFCLPSHQEGFSMAILEAAGAGLPVLITDKCHMPEISEVGAGLVVPDTVEAIEQALRRMLAMSDEALGEMGRRGAHFIEANFTWDRVAERLVAAYAGALGEDRS